MKFFYGERTLVVFVLILILGFILYGFAFKNSWKEVKALRAEVRTKKSELERLSSIETDCNRLNREINQLDSESHRLSTIPDMDEYERELISLFEDIVQGTGLVTGIRFEDLEDYEGYRVVTTTLLFETQDKNLKGILEGIEKAHIPLTLDKIRLSRIRERPIEGRYDWASEVVVKGISRKKD